MGHTRLGPLPRTRKWVQVVDLITAGASARQVAQATLSAAEEAFAKAAADPGLAEAVYLLARLPLAARGRFEVSLRLSGLDVPDEPGVMDVTAALVEALDRHFENNRGRTDVTELATTAAAEAVVAAAGPGGGVGLFGDLGGGAREALAELGTAANFGRLLAGFFARLAFKSLDSFVCRALPECVGAGGRFTTLDQEMEFTRALELHCRQAAVIVERFAGEWLGKNRWLHGDVTRASAAGFARRAMGKLVEELRAGAHADGD